MTTAIFSDTCVHSRVSLSHLQQPSEWTGPRTASSVLEKAASLKALGEHFVCSVPLGARFFFMSITSYHCPVTSAWSYPFVFLTPSQQMEGRVDPLYL